MPENAGVSPSPKRRLWVAGGVILSIVAATVLAAFTECFGGLAMIVGLLVRPAAVGLIFVMLVAIAKVHRPNGFFLNWALEPGKGHGYEMNLALIGMALAVLVGGAGALSIDRWLHPW